MKSYKSQTRNKNKEHGEKIMLLNLEKKLKINLIYVTAF